MQSTLPFLIRDYFDQLIIDVGQSPTYQAAEDRIRLTLFGWADPRGPAGFTQFENRLERALRGLPWDNEPPSDPDVLKTGAFVFYCVLCPFPLLNEKLKDSDFQATLWLLLQCPKSGMLTSEVICSLARKEDCDCRETLENMILLLAQHPDADFVTTAIARAASELVLCNPESLQDVRTTDAYRTAHVFLIRTLRDPPARLPSLLADIFQFFQLSLWAAAVDSSKKGVEVELIPLVMAFSKSRIFSVRCLAVTALLALRPLDELYQRGRYSIIGFNGRGQAVRHERLDRFFNSMDWEDSIRSPFRAFYEAWPADTRAISQHYKGAETDWRALALALAKDIQDVKCRKPEDASMEDAPEDDFPSLEEILPTLVDALDESFDPESATIIRLLASLVDGNLADLMAQAQKAVQDHPTCSYALCVLSLFPDCGSHGLSIAREGLRWVEKLTNCHVDHPHGLRDWLMRRASVHAWEQGLRMIRGATLDNVNSIVQFAAAFMESAHSEVEEIFGAKLNNEDEIQEWSDDAADLKVWYILLSVALYGSNFPKWTKTVLTRMDFWVDPPPLEDAWQQFTAFFDVPSGPQERAPWTEVVKHVDDLIDSGQGPKRPSILSNLARLHSRFCQRCKSPAALLTGGPYCPSCQARPRNHLW